MIVPASTLSASPASKDSGLTKSSRAPATIRSSLRFFFCERLCVTIARTIREGAVASCSPAFCSTAEGGCRRVGRSPYDARFVATHHTHDRFDSLFGLAILRRPFQVHRILRPGRNSLLPSLRVARLRTSTALMGFSPFAGLLPPVGGSPHRSFVQSYASGAYARENCFAMRLARFYASGPACRLVRSSRGSFSPASGVILQTCLSIAKALGSGTD